MMETTPTPTAEIALAQTTRPRCGTSVNVVRPLRWLHSLVTDKMAMIGKMIVIGTPMAAAKLLYVIASSGANRITAPVASRAVIAMLVISQNPDLVSNILRSSTPMIRGSGIGAGSGLDAASRPATRSTVMVLMLLLLLVVTLR